jgi:hypothetical protein
MVETRSVDINELAIAGEEVLWLRLNTWHGVGGGLEGVRWNVEMRLREGIDHRGHANIRSRLSLDMALTLVLCSLLSSISAVDGGLNSGLGLRVRHGYLLVNC